ncbi:helix-turn-helix domain-containing protein [Streptomyces sp. WG4]|uniref:helix-turn-helix domain-containing protein n=1 Tax=Streptomyces sp. WG4 TaxID=3417649 RepID=UPI003CF83A4F
MRRYRDLRGMSAQQLSDRCGELGLPIARSVLANFESGRRPTLSVAELLVLAEALGVPPTSLVFPVGYKRSVEVLPGVDCDTYRAANWWAGVGGWVGMSEHDRHIERVGVVLYDEHADLVREVEANRMTARMRLEEAARLDKERDKDLRAALFELSEAAKERAGQAEEVVIEIRAEMRRRGFMPPELPPDLDDVARVDQLMTQGESKANDEGGEAL